MRFCPSCGTRFSNDEVRFCPHDGIPLDFIDEDDEPAIDPLLGQVVDGRYRVEKVVGEGGMGVVYAVTHTSLNKRMALKVLRGEMASDPEVVQRFIQEAQASSSIGHANIIDISDFGRLEDGSVFFVMELLEGEALTDLIGRGVVPMHQAIPILHQIASALSAAHARGIIHRDLKPDNVFLIHEGDTDHFVKVVDFGIAKVGGSASKLTKTGMVFGTPHYMSPEQAAGQPVDARADVYALGVIMYEMATGHVPFDADTFMGILTQHMFDAPTPPSAENPDIELGRLEPTILRCLAKKPEDRFASMDDVADHLAGVATGQSIAPLPTDASMAQARGPALRRGPGGASNDPAPKLPTSSTPLIVGGALGLAALGLFLFGLAWYVISARPSSEAAATPMGSGPSGQAAATAALPEAAPPPIAEAPPPPAPTTVRLESDPTGATVLVDGALIGRTPLAIPKPSGERSMQIELRLSGHLPQTVQLSAHSGDQISAELEAEPRRVARRPRRASSRMASSAPMTTPAAMTTPTATRMSSSFSPEVVDPWGE